MITGLVLLALAFAVYRVLRRVRRIQRARAMDRHVSQFPRHPDAAIFWREP